jgi:hypothetical protein
MMNIFSRQVAKVGPLTQELAGWRWAVDKVWNSPMNTKINYQHEISCVQQAINDITVLEKIPHVHPAYNELFQISNDIKQKISPLKVSPDESIFQAIDKLLSMEIEKNTLPGVLAFDPQLPRDPKVHRIHDQTSTIYQHKLSLLYRLHLTRNYFQSMDKAVKENGIPLENTSNSDNKDITTQAVVFDYKKFLECLLVGTASERIQGKTKKVFCFLYSFYRNFCCFISFFRTFIIIWSSSESRKSSNRFLFSV